MVQILGSMKSAFGVSRKIWLQFHDPQSDYQMLLNYLGECI